MIVLILPLFIMLSFNDTATAFKHKSNSDLHKARRLFKMFSYPFLVEKGPLIANFCLAIGLPIKKLIKDTIFYQFCGGEDIESSHSSAQELYFSGIGAILDYSVEGQGTESSFNKGFDELSRVIEFASAHKEYPFAVFKCTGIGSTEVLRKLTEGEQLTEKEKGEYDAFKKRVNALCSKAHALNIPIFIDAEESWIQDPIDALCYEMMELYNKEKAIVFNTIQLYRKNMIPEMEKQIAIAREKGYFMGYKLVRGAYMEKEAERAQEKGYPNPIQDSKEDTDRDYDKAVKLCFDNRDMTSLCAGSHNENSNMLLAQLMRDNNIDVKDPRFWFAQLYGMSDHISYNLASEGFNVAKYLPYGPVRKVLPYLARRAKENSSVRGQAGRELSLISQELHRRASN